MGRGKIRRRMGLLLCLLLVHLPWSSYGERQGVVTLGNDLTQEQRAEMLRLFGVKEQEVQLLVVTNEEERSYLEGVATEAQIGTKAISSAYVEGLEKGSGIQVETYNLTWVTKDMFRNALVTAGVYDARVVGAAPFNVSGTAALTGMLKAFEELRGEPLSQEQKQVANEEILRTGALGEEVGKEKAVELIQRVKETIVEEKVKNPEEIKRIILEISGDLNITLNQEQIASIVSLMEKVANLDLNTEAIKEQLKGIGEQLGNLTKENQEVKSLLERILDFFRRLLDSILGFVKGK